jgi:hypothetical protein
LERKEESKVERKVELENSLIPPRRVPRNTKIYWTRNRNINRLFVNHNQQNQK